MYCIKVICFILKPGDKGDVYVHPSCVILPHSHPVYFDTEVGGNLLLPSGFIAQGQHNAEYRNRGLAVLCPSVLKMEITYPCETVVFTSKSIRCHKSCSHNARTSFFCFGLLSCLLYI